MKSRSSLGASMDAPHVIFLPNALGGGVESTESILATLAAVKICPTTIAMGDVRFVHPYGAVVLFTACLQLSRATGYPVGLAGLRLDVHAYLRRIDFFNKATPLVYAIDPFDPLNDLSRSSASSNVLELIQVVTKADVYEMSNRARRILTHWLHDASYDIDQVVTVLAEVCSNVVDHSQSCGYVVIQKYNHGHYVEVQLAISDLGVGIRGSLTRVYGNLEETGAGYIWRAVNGLSSRSGERGGQGLAAIRRIATGSGGSLSIRSGTGFVRMTPNGGVNSHDGLAFFPGTQAAIVFRGRAET